MKCSSYDKPIEDTSEIVYEEDDNSFIERILPYEGEDFYKVYHKNLEYTISSLGGAFIIYGMIENGASIQDISAIRNMNGYFIGNT